jgi:hypothetical protein
LPLKLILSFLEKLQLRPHLFVAGVPHPGRALVAARTRAPLEFFNLENLLSFWGTFGFRVVDLVLATLVIQYFLHLLLGYETTMVPEPIFGQIFSA